ncbi:selenium metabolism-associated LysR family transcriptional regulator [Desulfonatronum thioautotrophicum]|uniref:selenium metabolism-associated LysR family transcriptional regulator n=1 Tax=Desulfonatronum thioautotrophicum TaxID=617001 RepID=UPI0005EB2C7D|nr:selenium metabolism-associated LysR family transcriptional regulator [Desulfonatronum thioautotrophicum]
MDIRQLRAFAKVYERRSFSRAAEELLLSQPTVSAHVASLEQQMQIALFDRLGRSILPTQAADILYVHCGSVFSSLDQAESEIRLLSNDVSGELRLGGSTIPANFLFPELVSDFLLRFPNVRISLSQGDSSDILERVRTGELSVGVVGAKSETSELITQELVADALVVLAAPCFFSRHTRPVSLSSLRYVNWVMRQPGSGTRLAVEQALEKVGLPLKDLNVVCVVDGTEALLRFVRSGLGITVSSRLAAKEYLQRGELVALDIPGLHFVRSFYAVSHPSRHQFPAVRFFLKFLMDIAARLQVPDNEPIGTVTNNHSE